MSIEKEDSNLLSLKSRRAEGRERVRKWACAQGPLLLSPPRPAPPHQQRQQKKSGGEASSFLSFLLSAFCSPPCFSRKEKRHKTAMRKKNRGGGRKKLIRPLGRDFPPSFHGRMRAAVHFLSLLSLPPTIAVLPCPLHFSGKSGERGAWGAGVEEMEKEGGGRRTTKTH